MKAVMKMYSKELRFGGTRSKTDFGFLKKSEQYNTVKKERAAHLYIPQ